MWSNYTKTYVFRDCFESEQVEGQIKQINDLLANYQCLIGTGVLLVTTQAKSMAAFNSKDTGELELSVSDGTKEIAFITTCEYKEIQLQFEIEENLETNQMLLHGCEIKAFKEYQM